LTLGLAVPHRRRGALPDFSSDREMIDRELDVLLPDTGATVARAMRYAVFGGGQRVRPLLSLRVARILRTESPAVMRAAAAAELVHCASLVVDDLPCMDDSPLRRGRPSVHIEFGEATAVLASFAMVALAARCTMDPVVTNGSGARLAKFQWNLLGCLDPGSLIQGQSLDLDSPAPAQSALITELKTVPLFELAVEAGGVSSPQYDRREAEFRAFARQFGRAFQATDDYLDHDLEDARGALVHVERASSQAARLGLELTELTEYLYAKLTQHRSHR
jgi:farnesyl diphosphate synthase